jgi:hypothetical protein
MQMTTVRNIFKAEYSDIFCSLFAFRQPAAFLSGSLKDKAYKNIPHIQDETQDIIRQAVSETSIQEL